MMKTNNRLTTDHVTDHVTGNVTGKETDNVTGTVTGTVAGTVADSVDETIVRLVLAVRGNTKSVKEIMDEMGLRGEDNFRTRYLRPAQKQEFLTMLYPDSPHASNQAYYLTSKGLELLKKLKK